MKHVFLFFILLAGFVIQVNAQALAYIDSDFIMGKIPEYAEAKTKLDKLAETWTKDIEDRYKVVKQQKDNFNKEEILLPSEEKAKRKSEIEKLEKETLDLQSQRFGLNGDYFMKRQDLIKPIQDRIYTAMKKVAKAEGYSFVFDKANQNNLIYADSEADISEYVLDEMGISKE
jgi:outer membrane protein